jgi:hypothetical protein
MELLKRASVDQCRFLWLEIRMSTRKTFLKPRALPIVLFELPERTIQLNSLQSCLDKDIRRELSISLPLLMLEENDGECLEPLLKKRSVTRSLFGDTDG